MAAYAAVSVFLSPDPQRLKDSHGVMIVCQRPSEFLPTVFRAQDIVSVVTALPYHNWPGYYYIIEELGLDVVAGAEPDGPEDT